MDLNELKEKWLQQNQPSANNVGVNKEVLARIMSARTATKVTWLRIRSLGSLLVPLPLLVWAALTTPFNPSVECYIAAPVVVLITLVYYVWAVRYHWLLNSLDMSQSLVSIQKALCATRRFKLKTTHYSLILAPFYIVGIFTLAQIPVFDVHMVPVYALILLVMGLTIYFSIRRGTLIQLKQLDEEIAVLTALENE